MPVTAQTIPGEGNQLAVKIASAFVDVAEVTEVNGVAISVAAVETTSLGSALHTNRPSRLPKPEEMTLVLWFDPSDTTSQNIFWQDVNTPGTVRDFQITFAADENTTHALAAFSGFVTKFELTGVKIEENIGAEVTVQLTTLVVYTPGTP